MGFFDFISGIKRPAPGTLALSASDVKKKVLALNRTTAPYQIRDGASEGFDLIAEWKIVDAKWYGIFEKAGLKDTFKIYLKFDATKNEVLVKDERFTVEWHAGVPTFSLSSSSFSGQANTIKFGTAYGFTEELSPGQIYNYNFNTSELKNPIQKAVTDCGWVYKGIV